MSAALVSARERSWGAGDAAQLRSVLAATAYAMGLLCGTTYVENDVLFVDMTKPPNDCLSDHTWAAGVLYQTPIVLMSSDDIELQTVETANSDAGALPVLAVIGITVIGAVALGYCAHVAAEVVDRQLSRVESSKRVAEAHAKAVQLVQQHSEKELAAKKQLPLSAAEKSAFHALQRTQEKALAEEKFSNFLPGGISAGAGVGIGLTPIIAGAVALVLLMRK